MRDIYCMLLNILKENILLKMLIKILHHLQFFNSENKFNGHNNLFLFLILIQ